MDTSFLMMHTGWFIVICIVLFLFFVLMSLYAVGSRYPMTAGERAREMAGDSYFKDTKHKMHMNQAVTINAPADRVWKYVKQTNLKQAGWYSYDWLERFFTMDIWNCYLLKPSWQELKVGDYQWMRQAGFPAVFGNWVRSIDEEKRYVEYFSDSRVHPTDIHAAGALKLYAKFIAWTYVFEVEELDEYNSRLRMRVIFTWKPYWLLFFPVGQLLKIPTLVMTAGYMDLMRKLCNDTLYISNRYLSNKYVLPEEEVMPKAPVQ